MIKSIKNIGVGLFFAQVLSIVIQLLIAKYYSPESLGEFSFTLQISAIFSIIFFLRREYFVVEINHRNFALAYINLSVLKGLIRLLPVIVFALLINVAFDKVTYGTILFGIAFGMLLSYNISLQQILNMQGRFFKSGLTEVIFKIIYLLALLFFIKIVKININYISLSFLIALIGRMIYSLKLNNHYPFKRLFNNITLYKKFDSITFKGVILSKNNAISAVSGLAPMLYIMYTFQVADLGYFTMAETLLSLPITIIGNSISQVIYKYLSDNSQNIVKKDIYKILFILMSTSLCFLIVYPFGEVVILAVLGVKWSSSISVLFILIPNYMISYISKPFERNCYILGKPNWHIISALIKLFLILFSIVCSFYFHFSFYKYLIFFSIFTSLHYIIDFVFNFKLIYNVK